MTRRYPFTQADVSRALKGAAAAGIEVGRVEIDPATGRIVIVSTALLDAHPELATEANPWDGDADGDQI